MSDIQDRTAAPPVLDVWEARRRYAAFLPPPPFRHVDPALFEMRFSADPADTVRGWLAALPHAEGDPNAAAALAYAEGHLRTIHPELVAGYEARRAAGVAPGEAMATAAVAAGVSLHRPADLATAPAPIDEALGSYVAAGDRRALCEVVQALGERRDELWRWSEDVAARERARARPPPPEAVTPAAVAGLVADLVADSGDDLATVASGLGVDEAWVRAVLAGDVAEVDPARVAAMCAALEVDPAELFGSPEPPLVDSGVVPPPPTTAAQMMVDVGGFLRADELVVEVEALDPAEVAELVRAVATRHAQLEAWADHLSGCERDLAAAPAPTLPAAPVVAELVALVAETGDDLATVATNLGLAPQWAADVVAGRLDVVELDDARRLCDALDLDPLATFGPAGAALAPDRWAVVPYDPFTADAHVEAVEVEMPAPVVLDLGP
ncbi:MAG: hypothetical protein ACLGIO_08875 [Acidimicrobiia bacterium]